ncbi:MAG: hypothetical protein LH618_00370 [Saprospiraceae bacterium]|nr:hypothetical protein [Saprospiraceae bacterium]
MLQIESILEKEQVILDAKGQPEYVVLPIDRYKRLLQLLEDYGLGQAILEAEMEPRHTKLEALSLLEEDDH